MAKVITFGEIMLRLATPGYLRFNQAKQFEATFGATFFPKSEPIPAISSFVLITVCGPV